MARIPEEEIERLKREVSLERLAAAAGVELRARGKDLVGLCPFHEDREPSLVVTPSKNLWHCLGACGAGGTVVDWVMRREKVSFRRAVEVLRDLAGYAPLPVARGPAAALPPDLGDRELLGRVADFYHETLKRSPEALEYLDKRGLRSPEALEKFRLGYADRTLAYRLPARNRQAGAELRGRLQGLGLLRESGHEHFNGALTVPVFGAHGEVLGIYGRKVGERLRPGTPLHLYLAGPHRGVWNSEALAASKEVVLCEALLDALTFWVHGFRNVTAAYGVNGFTEDHLAAFRKHGTERVLIAYDRDEAGDKAAEALSRKLLAEGIECFRVQFPRGMDANEYARKMSPPAKALDLLLRNAQWLGGGRGGGPGDQPSAVPGDFSLAAPAAAAPAGEPAAKQEEAGAPPASAEDPAAVPPVRPPEPVPVEVDGDEIAIRLGDRRWRVRGLARNLSCETLRVNLLVSRPVPPAEGFHVDTLDLYSARQRAGFAKQAALELGLREEAVKADLGRVLRKLEELQDGLIRQSLAPKEKAVELTDGERAEALALLREPGLLERILADFETCGVVGEETNKLVGYLAAVSRKLDKPLAVLVQSSSAAGKSALMEAVLAFMPEEEKVKYSAMTGQSLFYMSGTDLKHKILAVAEEEGAERAAYALKLLQSEGELAIASTGKDPATGRLVTHEYKVEGPVMIFLTTTAIEIDEELQNRCVVLTVDENREQTRAIHRLQRELRTLEGYARKRERARLLRLHRNAQRLLRRLPVINPYARRLTFLDDRTRTRRDHDKYLDLIEAVALLHQYQRPVRKGAGRGPEFEYLEVTLEDIATANRLAGEVLGRSLDELPPQTRRFLLLLEAFVVERCEALRVGREDFRFSRRDVRAGTRWSCDQVRVHLDRLVELEYVLVHRGGRGQSFEYELLYDGQGKDGRPFLTGLIDADALEAQSPVAGTVKSWGGGEAGLGGPLGVHWAPVGGPVGGGKSGPPAAAGAGSRGAAPENGGKTHIRGNGKQPSSYPDPGRTSLSSLVACADGSGEPGRLPALLRSPVAAGDEGAGR